MSKGGMSHGEEQDGEEEYMAAWILSINTLKIQPFKLSPLEMKAIGIRSSDFHFPRLTSAGIIEEVGIEVKSLVPSDHVVLQPEINCWRCNLYKEGSAFHGPMF